MPISSIEAPGFKATGIILQTLREEVARLLGRKSVMFPGAQPVSFARKHLKALTEKDYYLCEKTDGMRYLLYLTHGDDEQLEVQYLIDRKNDYWGMTGESGIHLPIPGHEAGFHTKTIIDGELVMDKAPGGTLQPRFMVFDCLVIDGVSLMDRSLDKRLAFFRERIQDPYNALLRKYPQEVPYQAFLVQMKEFELGYGIEKMFKQVLKSLPHGNDGLIFTCRETHYKHGTDPNILKWKPADENSIDFRLELEFDMVQPDAMDQSEGVTEPYPDYDGMPICHLYVYRGDNNPDIQYGTMFIDPDLWDSLKSLQQPLNDRIVECHMDDNGRWRYMRFRDDKTNANHISTVESVIESIKDRVTEEDLMATAYHIRKAWKEREAKNQQAARQAQLQQAAKSSSGTVSGAVKRKAEEQGAGRPSPNPPGQKE
ncbi:mRNA capping enzyme, catalytic domain-containing protein [Bisporella sp. PMI_857]|nr:mRNA capping enzyme, catalytic domain-containing protein [Bisporella sp. PMI_857]